MQIARRRRWRIAPIPSPSSTARSWSAARAYNGQLQASGHRSNGFLIDVALPVLKSVTRRPPSGIRSMRSILPRNATPPTSTPEKLCSPATGREPSVASRVERRGDRPQDVHTFGGPRGLVAEAVLTADVGRRVGRALRSPVGAWREDGRRPATAVGDRASSASHSAATVSNTACTSAAALGGLDRQDRRRVGLVAEAEHVLTEVAEAASRLTLERGDRPRTCRAAPTPDGPDDAVELGRLGIQPGAQRIDTPGQPGRREVRVDGPGQAPRRWSAVAVDQADRRAIGGLDRQASQQRRRIHLAASAQVGARERGGDSASLPSNAFHARSAREALRTRTFDHGRPQPRADRVRAAGRRRPTPAARLR